MKKVVLSSAFSITLFLGFVFLFLNETIPFPNFAYYPEEVKSFFIITLVVEILSILFGLLFAANAIYTNFFLKKHFSDTSITALGGYEILNAFTAFLLVLTVIVMNKSGGAYYTPDITVIITMVTHIIAGAALIISLIFEKKNESFAKLLAVFGCAVLVFVRVFAIFANHLSPLEIVANALIALAALMLLTHKVFGLSTNQKEQIK